MLLCLLPLSIASSRKDAAAKTIFSDENYYVAATEAAFMWTECIHYVLVIQNRSAVLNNRRSRC